MAGNIIPAIAATNAIVAGLIVMTAFKVLQQLYLQCHTVFVNNRVNLRKELFAIDKITPPNSTCYVCTEKPELVIKVDLSRMTVRLLGERVLKKELKMVAPDVEIDDGQGTILISSEEGETDDIADKFLNEFNIKDGTHLKCDDFLQNYQLNLTILEMTVDEKDREKTEVFEIIGDRSQLIPKTTETKNGNMNGNEPGPSSVQNLLQGTDVSIEEDDDDCIIDEIPEYSTVTEEEVSLIEESPGKPKRQLPELLALPAKKRRIEYNTSVEDGYETKQEEIETVDLD